MVADDPEEVVADLGSLAGTSPERLSIMGQRR
jgi:hypothetical protein